MNSPAQLPKAPQLWALPDAYLTDLKKYFLPTEGDYVIASVKNAQFGGADHYKLSTSQIGIVRSVAQEHGVPLRI